MTEIRSFWEGSDLVVRVGESFHVDLVDAILDVDSDGQVLGIEVLELLHRHPQIAWLDCTIDDPKVNSSISIDPKADAIYVRLHGGRSVDQMVCRAVLGFDELGRIVEVRVRVEQ